MSKLMSPTDESPTPSCGIVGGSVFEEGVHVAIPVATTSLVVFGSRSMLLGVLLIKNSTFKMFFLDQR